MEGMNLSCPRLHITREGVAEAFETVWKTNSAMCKKALKLDTIEEYRNVYNSYIESVHPTHSNACGLPEVSNKILTERGGDTKDILNFLLTIVETIKTKAEQSGGKKNTIKAIYYYKKHTLKIGDSKITLKGIPKIGNSSTIEGTYDKHTNVLKLGKGKKSHTIVMSGGVYTVGQTVPAGQWTDGYKDYSTPQINPSTTNKQEPLQLPPLKRNPIPSSTTNKQEPLQLPPLKRNPIPSSTTNKQEPLQLPPLNRNDNIILPPLTFPTQTNGLNDIGNATGNVATSIVNNVGSAISNAAPVVEVADNVFCCLFQCIGSLFKALLEAL